VEQRLRKAEEEEPVGVALADHVLINDDLDATLARMDAIIRGAR
jgi:guanylate kinase